MKKGIILDLIRSHADGNEAGFRVAAYEIAREFAENGDEELAQFIMAQLAGATAFVPQGSEAGDAGLSDVFHKVPMPKDPFPLPDVITADILAIVRSVKVPMGVHTFLFYGAPGTGKTEAAKHVARMLKRDLYTVDFSQIIDSKLGQTSKNIQAVFSEINRVSQFRQLIFLFDEIDALALDRINQQDMREMGRATSTLLRAMDELNENAVLIATTNLSEHFDKALLRRFDASVDFNRYSEEDKVAVADHLLEFYLQKFKRASKNTALFHKILKQIKPLPSPGEMKNLIKRSVVFSDPEVKCDYLRRLYWEVCRGDIPKLITLKQQGFALRDMEVLTGRSKSQIARDIKEAE